MGMSMKDQLQKSPLEIWKDLHNVTSSRGLGGGQEHCNSLEYQKQQGYGPDRHHVNHFQEPESKKESSTKDTLHRHFLNSCQRANLQCSLGNRLQKLSKPGGWMIFTRNWKEKVTVSGLRYYHVISSVRRTSGTDFSSGLLTSWQTPTVTNISARSPGNATENGSETCNGEEITSAGKFIRTSEDVLRFWDSGTEYLCRDGKKRIVEPTIPLLADGVSSTMGRLRGYGNAIVPQVGALFIESFVGAYIDACDGLSNSC